MTYRTQGERPSYPTEPPAPASAPPAPVVAPRHLVVRRYGLFAVTLMALLPTAFGFGMGAVIFGRTSITCERSVRGEAPRCVGRDTSLVAPVHEELVFRQDDDVRVLEIDTGDSVDVVIGLPRGHLRAGVTRGAVREIVERAQSYRRDGDALRFEASRTFVLPSVFAASLGALFALFLATMMPACDLRFGGDDGKLTVTSRRSLWQALRRARPSAATYDLARAKAAGVRSIDDSAFEELVLYDGSERVIAVGSPGWVRDAASQLNDAIRALRDDVPEELAREERALAQRERADREWPSD